MAITRVVTINTGKCDGPYRERLRLLARQLNDLEPDIVALQECFAAEDLGLNTACFLAEALEMCLFASPARHKDRDCEGQEVPSSSGLALLARGSWLTMQTIALPSDPADGERIAQAATTCVRGHLIHVTNLHLTHLRGADDLRARQLRTALTAGGDAGQADASLVCGDFNTTIDGPVIRPFLSCGEGPRLIDTWTAGHGDANRGTLARTGPEGRCVDYILSLNAYDGSPVEFGGSRIVLDEPGPRGVLPSDHYGVLTELHFAETAP